MNCRMLYVKQIVFKKVFTHELSNAVFIYKVSYKKRSSIF